MRAYALEHLSDRSLLLALAALVARERVTTAELLAHIAEVDARRLYAPAGFPSMHAYCVEELHLSQDAAFKRIQAARTARKFPALFAAVADGRLHLTAVGMLAPYLIRENAESLIRAATHKTKPEIEALLARRFPRTESLPLVEAFPGPSLRPEGQLAPGREENAAESRPTFAMSYPAQLAPAQVAGNGSERAGGCGDQPSPGAVAAAAPRPNLAPVAPGSTLASIAPRSTLAPMAPGSTLASIAPRSTLAPVAPRSSVAPVAPERFVLHLTIDRDTHEMLRHAQALLGHQVPSGDLAEVLKRALGVYVQQLEKRKFASTAKPRPARSRASVNRRYIPAHVKRAVWARDGGRCTFVGEGGHRCASRKFLQFDHVEPVARGGRATVDGIRLRCRAHNQLEAERAFGAGFMAEKRDLAQRARAARRESAAALSARPRRHG